MVIFMGFRWDIESIEEFEWKFIWILVGCLCDFQVIQGDLPTSPVLFDNFDSLLWNIPIR